MYLEKSFFWAKGPLNSKFINLFFKQVWDRYRWKSKNKHELNEQLQHRAPKVAARLSLPVAWHFCWRSHGQDLRIAITVGTQVSLVFFYFSPQVLWFSSLTITNVSKYIPVQNSKTKGKVKVWSQRRPVSWPWHYLCQFILVKLFNL